MTSISDAKQEANLKKANYEEYLKYVQTLIHNWRNGTL